MTSEYFIVWVSPPVLNRMNAMMMRPSRAMIISPLVLFRFLFKSVSLLKEASSARLP